jgi:hypothetical protein
MGNVTALTTTTTTSLVAAVDELHGEHGTLSSLTTTAKSTFVAAINEVDSNADAAGTNASTALTRIGTLGSLTTTEKSNLVGAVNEVDANADTAGSNASTALTNIGTLASLTTTNKTNLVAAVNEVDGNADTAGTNASTALTNIGTLGSLNTTDKTNLVAAVNELEAEIDTLLGSAITSKSASSATVALDAGKTVYKFTGTATVTTLTPADAGIASVVFIVCAGSWSFGTGGNINRAYDPYTGEVICMAYDTNSSDWKFVNTAVGELSTLTTTAKTTAVEAINEVNTLAGWNKATTVNKTASSTVTLTAGVSRYNMTGTTTISSISAPAGSPTVIYLMDDGDGELSIDYGADNIVGAGLSGVNAHLAYEVVCLVYNDSDPRWQRVF